MLNTLRFCTGEMKAAYAADKSLLHKGYARIIDQKAVYELYGVRYEGRILYYLRCAYGKEAVGCYVFCNRAEAERLFFALLRGRVTPCSMRYIVDELIEDRESRVVDGV